MSDCALTWDKTSVSLLVILKVYDISEYRKNKTDIIKNRSNQMKVAS